MESPRTRAKMEDLGLLLIDKGMALNMPGGCLESAAPVAQRAAVQPLVTTFTQHG